MTNFTISPLDGGTVAILIFIIQVLKKHVMPRWIPVLPFLVGWVLAVPVVFVTKGAGLAVPVFVSAVFLEGLKMAVLSMATYKIGFTTIAGKDTQRNDKKV
jgi:hypothetical protein